MNKEEYLKILNDAFKDFKFFEEDHHYEYKGKRVGISVTRLIEEYCNEFNAEEMAEKVAKKNMQFMMSMDSFNPIKLLERPLPLTTQDVLNEWKTKNEWACRKGHNGHVYAQNLWTSTTTLPNLKNLTAEQIHSIRRVCIQANNFYNDFKDKLEHLADEFIIGSEECDIASAIDHLFINKATGELVLVDYKTNTDIHKGEYKPKKMKVPLQHLDDTKLNHYAIQLSIYKYLVEKYTGLQIEDMFIVWFSENIENYEIIEVSYLKNEVEKILRDRREKNMGKCLPVLIIGKSGSGKSTSLRNLNKEDYSLVNVLNKDLPFKNGRSIKGLATKDYELVKKFIKETPKNIVVIDDFGYIMTDKFVKKATETGYTKFSIIAQEFYNFVEYIKELDGDKRVYLMMHEEKSENGDIAPKTCGKMLDNQICVEGLFSILLRCIFDGKEHKFKTATDGLDVCKTPIDMFADEFIDNDLKFVDDTICEYYGIEKNKNENESEENK